jgi:hypothetical protein
MYELGRGVKEDTAEAKRLYQQAANNGFEKAKRKLESLAKREKAQNLDIAGAIERGTPTLSDEVESGEASPKSPPRGDRAQTVLAYQLGIMHLKGGGGVEKDDEGAVFMFRKSAEAGYAKAQVALGLIYMKGGLGVVKDAKQAVHWFEQAALQEFPSGQYYLALLHLKGRAVKQDRARAVRLLKSSAGQDYARAQVLLSLLLHSGQYVARDLARALAWARRAAELKNTQGISWFGRLLAKQKRFDEAAQWLSKATELGEPIARATLGWLYLTGKGIQQDIVKAESLIRQSAEDNVHDAQFLLGLMYLKGNGVPQDCALARKWLELSARQKNRRAKKLLAQLEIGFEACGGTV